MISTQQIHYILQLVETKNFSKAAESCFVTQPTLSMQIKKAEEVLGFLIFNRNKSPLELTTQGRELIPILREMSMNNNAILQLSKKANGTFIEELNIGIIPTISAYLIPTLYLEWKKKLTHTKLLIKENTTENILELLENKKIDLAIIAGPVNDSKWIVNELYQEELLVYTKNRTKKLLHTNDLSGMNPWLLSKGNCLRSQMMQFCSVDNDIEEWSFEGGNIELLMKMVDINGGYTLVPKNYQSQFKSIQGSLQSIKDSITNVTPARTIIAMQSIRTKKNESIQLIIDTVKRKFQKSHKQKFNILDWK